MAKTPLIVRALVLLVCTLVARPTLAVITYFDGIGARSVRLQVGSNDATVNTVTFDVLNATIAPTGGPVTGVPGGGAPATTPVGGIVIIVTTNRRGGGTDVVKLNANSSAGLACQSGTCLAGAINIPFSTIGWTSYEPTGGAFSAGIPSGVFNGGAAQNLFSHTIPAGDDSMTVSNVLIFSYDNATLYPSGTYTGRVTYTVTVP